MKNLLQWDIYEISSNSNRLHAIKLRGRLRKFAILNNFNLLTENATDTENIVRFAVLIDSDIHSIREFLKGIIEDVHVKLIANKIVNPVLSKMAIDDESRYLI